MKIKTFLNNNSILFFSWYCALFCIITERIIFKEVQPYLTYMTCCCSLLLPFIIFSIFYSFHQSIKNSNINKILASVLLIFYFVFWILFFMFILGDRDNIITKLFVFIFINICICLYHKINKEKINIIPYLLFYGYNSIFLLSFLPKIFSFN